MAGDVFAIIRRNPVQNATIILAVLTAVVGMSFGLRWVPMEPSPSKRQPSGTLAEALAALDVDDRDKARSIAADLRLVDDLPEHEVGGPAYVLGVAMARDAEEQWSESERRIRFLLGARYLQEAKAAAFPTGRTGHGLFVLGKSLHGAGRFAQSLPVLHEALEANLARRTEILGLLADAYLRDAPPQYDKAFEYNREYLADDALSSDNRYRALMTQGEILFGRGEFASCEATISAIPESSPHFATALLLRSRLLLREGDQLASTPGDPAAAMQAIERFTEARQRLDEARDHNPTELTLARQAQYLTGLAYRKAASLRPQTAEASSDLQAALDEFGRTWRTHFDTAEGISASLEEAEIRQLLGEDDEAINVFRQTLRFVADAPVTGNPWLSPEELRNRVDNAYRAYREAGRFDYATRLAAAMTPVFPESHAIQLQAEAREAAAGELAEKAEQSKPLEAQRLLVDSRSEHRSAGALYAQLANLRVATRSYPDDLWKSAENYQRGQDFERAVRYYTQYLNTQSRGGRPPALTAIGESTLALHEPEKALPYLMECIQDYPRDPHSYRARVIAAKAHQELGNLGQARALLEINLEHDSLTPSSIEWRESLFGLGELLYLEGVQHETLSRLEGAADDQPAIEHLQAAQNLFHEAIGRLDEAVRRDPDARQAIEARYRIAEAYRHAAKLPRRKLDSEKIAEQREQLTDQLNRELKAADEGYRQLIRDLSRRQDELSRNQEKTQEQSKLSGIERRILRNCYFARADVLFEMADARFGLERGEDAKQADVKHYEDAIQAYREAAIAYQDEPESLEAFVQLAHCQRRSNRPSEARSTVEDAKKGLQLIPPDADFLKTTRYDRAKWGEYLNWLGTL